MRAGLCESFRVLMCACTVWTFCPPPFYFEFFGEHRWCAVLHFGTQAQLFHCPYPHLVIWWVRARTDSGVTCDFTGVFATQVRDCCFEEPSEQPDVHSSRVWRDSGVFFFFLWHPVETKERRSSVFQFHRFELVVLVGLHQDFQHQLRGTLLLEPLLARVGLLSSLCFEQADRVSEPLLRCRVTLSWKTMGTSHRLTTSSWIASTTTVRS